jgi:uncharacterized protein (DUF1800 family)
MLKWLDNARSEKAHPNENFARELMELFTLGIGNYTEQDVRESARAFTGFTFARARGNSTSTPAARRRLEDLPRPPATSTATTSSTSSSAAGGAQAVRFEAARVLRLQRSGARARRRVAALIRKNDFAMAPVMSTLLRSNVFYSDRAYRALVKSPVEFVIGTYQLFGVTEAGPK